MNQKKLKTATDPIRNIIANAFDSIMDLKKAMMVEAPVTPRK
tara:strand:+ start:874 stop:999 length:126 start_codon:yes stop_codon:yes gene_type:complete